MSYELTPSSISVETPAAPRKGMRLSPAIVAAIVGGVVLAGGYVVYSGIFSTRTYNLDAYELNEGPQAAARSRIYGAASSDVAIARRDDGSGDIRLSAARVRVRKKAEQYTLDSSYFDLRFVNPVDYDAYLARANALGGNSKKVTPEQREQLKAIVFSSDCLRSDAEKQTILALWTKYASAPAAEQEKQAAELKQAVGRMVVANMPVVTRDFADSAKKVREILGDTLVTELRNQRPR